MSIYNEDELVAPDWINEKFFETILQNYENNENIKINNLDISPACLKGDHYASIMFRCKINYKDPDNKHISVILKTLPVEGIKAEMLKDSQVFETEIAMYTETLPKIEKILLDIEEPTKMSAQLIYHSLQPHKCIIMEDLCEAGYDTVRGRYLTENEMKMVYAKIAKFHAVSYMLGQSEEHEIVTKYKDGFFSSSSIMSMDFIRNGIWNFMKMLSEHKEFAIYLEKIKAMQPDINKATIDLYNAFKSKNKGPGDIFVLNHGDFHMKNLMFKFNSNNEMQDLIFVDYQLNCYAPSTIDTIYSQYTILSPELRLRKNELMQYYFAQFIRVLKKLNFQGPLPLYSDFRIADYRYRHFGLFLLSTFLPTFTGIITSNAEVLKDIDGSKILENTDLMSLAYKNPHFINDMRNYLPQMLMDGYLD